MSESVGSETKSDSGLAFVRDLLTDWTALRQVLREIESAEHPDLMDHHGRTWEWKSEDLWVHDQMGWPRSMILDGRHSLPSPKLADDPNYRLCEICTREWPS